MSQVKIYRKVLIFLDSVVPLSGRTVEPIKHAIWSRSYSFVKLVIKYPAIIASITLLDDLHVVLKLYNAGIHSPNIALYL